MVALKPERDRAEKRVSTQLQLLRWSLMAAAVFWTLLFRVGMEVADIPEFVYVNF